MWISDQVVEHVGRVTAEPDLSGTKYKLGSLLGRGGMGAVYAAEDTALGREVAIKVSSRIDGADSDERFTREARFLAKLEHPGIVPIHDAGVLPDGRAYYVMKLVRGTTLATWRHETRDRRATLRLFQRVCEAVAFAHARGVIHRDLKPENVMVGEFGEALVMDWGIAAELRDAPSPSIDRRSAHDGDAHPCDATATGTLLGTPGYMSPEQARGDTSATQALSDVYSLGAMLSFVLTGRSPTSLIHSTVIDAVGDEIEKPLAAIRARAMATSPSDRYQTVLDLSADVGRFLEAERVSAHRESAVERLIRFAGRNKVVLSLFGAYLMARALVILLAR